MEELLGVVTTLPGTLAASLGNSENLSSVVFCVRCVKWKKMRWNLRGTAQAGITEAAIWRSEVTFRALNLQ